MGQITDNLSTKNITEFVKGDTIYMKTGTSDHPMTVFCTFTKYDKGVVYGRAISVDINTSLYERKIQEGWDIKSRLTNCALYGKDPENKTGHGFYHWFNAQGYALDPMEEYKVDEMGDLHVKKHPSFGLVHVSRRQHSRGQTLFGSSIKSGNVIALEIKRAEHNRDLNNDWYYGTENIVEIEMTQTQFAELITSMNYGSGVPCTIRTLGADRMSDPPFVSKVQKFQKEFENKLHNLSVDLQKLVRSSVDILENKPNINKGDREFILGQIKRLMMEVSSNIPYVSGQFIEQMGKTVDEAKGEIEAFVNNKIQTAGLKALKDELTPPSIEGRSDDDKNAPWNLHKCPEEE